MSLFTFNSCMYNTLVLYDNTGMLVAKYHKWNLFNTEMPWFNIDPEPQNVYVDTDFGENKTKHIESAIHIPGVPKKVYFFKR